MPDDLTTWRVMAVALGNDDAGALRYQRHDFRFDPAADRQSAAAAVRASGDSFDLGVSIANQTGAGGALGLVLKLTGALAFAQGDPRTQTQTNKPLAGMQAFRFPVIAGTPAPSSVRSGEAGCERRRVQRAVHRRASAASTDSVIESGAPRKKRHGADCIRRGGSLQMTLANSIVPQFAVPSSDTA